MISPNRPIGCPASDSANEIDSVEELKQRVQQLAQELECAKDTLNQQAQKWQRSERALYQRETRYLSILNNLSDLVCCFSADGILTFVNRAYCDYFGKRPEELLGQNF